MNGDFMNNEQRRLYQFPLSLYCEKTRWILDFKQLPWTPVNLMPGPHAFTAWRLARLRTLPVLDDGGRITGDSTRIALYLEAQYPASPLLPDDAALRTEVLALEELYDHIGDHVRRCVWSEAVHTDLVDAIFFREYDRARRRLGAFARPLLRQMIRHTFNVFPADVAASWPVVLAALECLETTLQGDPGRYLAGNRFTLADLTAATMLAPLVGPEESPWGDRHVPAAGAGRRGPLRESVAGRWVQRVYTQYRLPHPVIFPPPVPVRSR